MNIYGIKDIKSSEFINIFLQKNELMCFRYVESIVSNPSSQLLFTNTEDFELYFLGTMNMENGQIDSSVPEFIKNCLELKNARKKL